jgi:hypothetical protein
MCAQANGMIGWVTAFKIRENLRPGHFCIITCMKILTKGGEKQVKGKDANDRQAKSRHQNKYGR